MSDNYELNEEQVYAVSNSLLDIINEYKQQIVDLSGLVDEINNSSAWKDVQVKTSFISTCHSYITKYKSFAYKMEQYRNYLTGKTDSGVDLDNAYATGGKS